MTGSVTNINSVNTGTCPHGMAPGACPICSGMGGGSRMGERPQKAGEWSYHKCAMMGALMKAREAREEAHEKNLNNHILSVKAFEQALVNASKKMAEFVSQIQSNLLLKPVAFVIKNTFIPTLNTVKNVITVFNTLLQKLSLFKEKIFEIQDKLNAIFGEAKAFIDKKISEIISTIKTKIKSLYTIFRKNSTENEDNKIDEDKKIFRLKSFINKILRKNQHDTEN